MRSALLQRVLALLAIATSVACDEKKAPPPEPEGTPAPAVSEIGALGVDASVLGDPIDPPAPAGDLKTEMDRFVNVDTCVSERAKLDPLVGDALGALGYETFLRDACRLLEAAKDKKRETCERIDASALRARCQSWVAMVSQTPDACPMQFEGLVTRGRHPTCVAVASRDPRLCNGEPRAVQRGTCEAMVARDPARCGALLPSHRSVCQREVARWRSVLAPPLEGLDKLPTTRAKLVVHGALGTPDPPVPEVDLAADFVRGVVVVTSRERMRVELGTVVESEAARIAASPQKRARVGLALLLEPPAGDARRLDPQKKETRPVLQKLEIELPGEAPIVSPPVACDCKITSARVANQRGGEAAIVLEGSLNGGGRAYKVTIDVLTYVRDVVPEQTERRILPPVHPFLRGLGRDGG